MKQTLMETVLLQIDEPTHRAKVLHSMPVNLCTSFGGLKVESVETNQFRRSPVGKVPKELVFFATSLLLTPLFSVINSGGSGQSAAEGWQQVAWALPENFLVIFGF